MRHDIEQERGIYTGSSENSFKSLEQINRERNIFPDKKQRSIKRMIEYEGGGDVDFGWVGHVHQSAVEHFERAGKDIIAVVSGTYKERDKWASQNRIGGRGQQGGIALMLYPGERRMEAFKDIQTAVDLMTDYV